MPIKALNTYIKDWMIKARVAKKFYCAVTSSGGALLKIELVDQYGTSIEGAFFKNSAEKFEKII